MMKPSDRPNRFPGHRDSGSKQPQLGLAGLWTQVQGLETRLHHLKVGLQNLMDLEQIESSPPGPSDTDRSQAEIANLQRAVEELEHQLAHHLIRWEYWQEPFWQALRYGGLGLLIGWGLAWLAYRS
ncbi:MAG: hypothetical protein ACOYMP_06965 [Nodosilinea sp.]